jgi:hypothetical protein
MFAMGGSSTRCLRLVSASSKSLSPPAGSSHGDFVSFIVPQVRQDAHRSQTFEQGRPWKRDRAVQVMAAISPPRRPLPGSRKESRAFLGGKYLRISKTRCFRSRSGAPQRQEKQEAERRRSEGFPGSCRRSADILRRSADVVSASVDLATKSREVAVDPRTS